MSAAARYPEELSHTVTATDGTRALVRAIRPEDAERLMAFHDRLGEHTIRQGAPMATIEEPLVPIFMYHRYTVESAASMVAGIDYIYAMRGDGRTPMKWETAVNQRKALDAL